MRLVSLCPSVTETLIDFGLESSLVGVTRFCIHPKDVTQRLPKVGGTKDPDLEAIRRAHPDLIFLNEEENTKEVYATLSSEFRVDVSFPKRVSEVPGCLRHFGSLTGTETAADCRARELESALDALDHDKASRSAQFTFAYLIWKNPWMAVGGDTYVSDLFERAGGRNAYGTDGERYPTIGLDDLRKRAPELVLLPDEPYPFRERDEALVSSRVPGARVVRVSGDDCCWHGVRSIRGVRLARETSAFFARRPDHTR